MRRSMPRIAAALLLLAPFAGAVPAQEETFREEASVVVVEVPVEVVEDGKPVRGLSAENFEVWDGKLRRPIASFEVLDLAAPEEARARRLPTTARRNFLLLFDPQDLVTAAKRGKLVAMSEQFAQLARLLRDVEGRKALVLFSDGFDDDLLLGQASERAISSVGLSQGQVYGNARGIGTLNRMLEEFRRSGWIIHTVEATGVGGARVGREGLFYVANETGGTFFNNSNDLGEAMGRMLAASSVTYLLSFAADDVPADGAFRNLRVELKGAPRGARAVHRAGYHAPLPPSQRRGPERLFTAAELVVAGKERADIPMTVLATPFRSAGGGTYVPVVVEVDGAVLAAEREDGGVALELFGYAFDADGQVQDFFSQQVKLEPAVLPAALDGGLRFVADLELPVGAQELRLLLRGAASGRTTLIALSHG